MGGFLSHWHSMRLAFGLVDGFVPRFVVSFPGSSLPVARFTSWEAKHILWDQPVVTFWNIGWQQSFWT